MFDIQLFLGLQIDSILEKELRNLNPRYLEIFIEKEKFLVDICHNNQRYLGKFIGKVGSISSLELLEKNIYSILKKILPNYPYQDTSLMLFPTSQF